MRDRNMVARKLAKNFLEMARSDCGLVSQSRANNPEADSSKSADTPQSEHRALTLDSPVGRDGEPALQSNTNGTAESNGGKRVVSAKRQFNMLAPLKIGVSENTYVAAERVRRIFTYAFRQ